MKRATLVIALLTLTGRLAGAQTIAYFPRVLATGDTATGLALSNPTADPATVTLTYLNNEGSAVGAPAVVTVTSGGQIARLSTELFTGAQGQRGWVRMSSNIAGVAGFYLNGDFVLTTDGGEFAAAARTITFQWIVQSGSTTTEITLTNPNDAAISVQLSLYAADGTLVRTRSASVARNAQLIGTIRTLLEVDSLETGYLRADSSENIFGAAVVRDGVKDFAMLNARADASVRTLIFPHIATGGGYSTALFIQNTGATTQSVTLQFFLDSGASGAANVTVSLSPGQLLRRTVQEAFGLTSSALQTGWVRASADADVLDGFQVFLAVEPGGITALPARKTGATRLLQSHIAEQTSAVFRSTDLFTGLALLNPNAQPVDATITLVTREGAVLSDSTQTLRPLEKRALLLREMMPEVLGETSGTVWVRSAVPIFGLQVFGTWNLGVLSQIPAQSTESITRLATPTATRYAISGTVTTTSDAALGGITIDAAGPIAARATTNYTGAFVVKNLPAGTYVLTPSRSDVFFTPATAAVNVERNARGVAFALSKGTAPPPPPPPSGGGSAGGGTTPPSGLSVTPQEVELRITSSIGVGAYQVTFTFNPSILSLADAGVSGGTAPFNDTPIANINNVTGEVTLGQFQTSGSPTGTFTVARLRFTAKAAGTSDLTVTRTSFSNTSGATISANVGFSSSSVSVRP